VGTTEARLGSPATSVGPLAETGRRVAGALAPWACPLTFYLLSRQIVLVALQLAGVSPLAGAVPWPVSPTGGRIPHTLAVWDSGWYLYIAGHGYVTALHPATGFSADMAFFPLFPAVIRATAALSGLPTTVAGLVDAFLLGAGATVAVWCLVREIGGRAEADWVVALWCLFPGSYVLSMVYAEGLTVLCAAACLLALLRRRWLVAGIAAALAGATQPDALVLVACCGWAAVADIRQRREWAALLAPAVAPLGAAAYLVYLWARTADPLAWYHIQARFWHGQVDPARSTVALVARFVGHPADPGAAVAVAGLAFLAAAILAVRRWRPPAVVSIFGLGVVAAALASGPIGARPRFLLAAFPLVVAVARLVPRRAQMPSLLASGSLMAILAVVTTAGLALPP